MPRHAIAMVRWDVFRPGGGTGGAAVCDFSITPNEDFWYEFRWVSLFGYELKIASNESVLFMRRGHCKTFLKSTPCVT